MPCLVEGKQVMHVKVTGKEMRGSQDGSRRNRCKGQELRKELEEKRR